MKLVTYNHRHQPKPGIVTSDFVIDLAAAHAVYRGKREPFPADMLALLRRGAAGMQQLHTMVDWVERHPSADFLIPLDEVVLQAPLSNPGKIICVGFNYQDACQNNGISIPEKPVLFSKFPSSIIGPGQSITWQDGIAEQVDYEAELALIIGRETEGLTEANAMDYIAGYTILNDISARDVMLDDQQWMRGKSFDTFCPMGPYLVTADEVSDPHNLGIICTLNGQIVQQGHTSQMIFPIPALLAYITQTTTLLPGDVVSTGTPDGIGFFREPQLFLKDGDRLMTGVEGLGKLYNPVEVRVTQRRAA